MRAPRRSQINKRKEGHGHGVGARNHQGWRRPRQHRLEHSRPDLCAQVSVSESSFAWHATFPPDTFVPPHIHPTQDEFIYMFEGQFELMLDGRDVFANPGDLVRMPMGLPHAIYNKSGRTVKCLFWVSPTAPALRPLLGDPQHGRADAGRGGRALRQARSRLPAAARRGEVSLRRR